MEDDAYEVERLIEKRQIKSTAEISFRVYSTFFIISWYYGRITQKRRQHGYHIVPSHQQQLGQPMTSEVNFSVDFIMSQSHH